MVDHTFIPVGFLEKIIKGKPGVPFFQSYTIFCREGKERKEHAFKRRPHIDDDVIMVVMDDPPYFPQITPKIFVIRFRKGYDMVYGRMTLEKRCQPLIQNESRIRLRIIALDGIKDTCCKNRIPHLSESNNQNFQNAMI
jgi:hypothetical protein